MKNFCLLLIVLLPLFVYSQELDVKHHSVTWSGHFDSGFATRTLNFYVTETDTLVEAIYKLEYTNGKENYSSNNIRYYKDFIVAEKIKIKYFVETKLVEVFKELPSYKYDCEVNFPNLWFSSSLEGTFGLHVENGERYTNIIFGVLAEVDQIRNSILREIGD